MRELVSKAFKAPRTKRGRMWRLFVGYGLATLALVAVLVVGSKGQQLGDNNFTYLSSSEASTSVSFINVVETSIVAQSADVANLASAGNTRDMANTLATIFAAGGWQDQPIAVITAPRGVERYQVREGDTIASIAKARGITEQTLRWANNMKKTVQASVDQVLLLPAINGVIYTWVAGDTIEQVAVKYKGDVQQIIAYNELDSRELQAGETIFVPDGILPEKERPDYVTPLQAVISAGQGNTYGRGECTYYAFSRRRALGLPVENSWGHARTWATRARAMGYAVGTTPAVGAVIQDTGGAFGHVGIVESINKDGTITISEMNYRGAGGGGWNRVSRRNIAMEVADGSWYRAQGRSPLYNYIY